MRASQSKQFFGENLWLSIKSRHPSCFVFVLHTSARSGSCAVYHYLFGLLSWVSIIVQLVWTLKRQCHDNRWILAAILCGEEQWRPQGKAAENDIFARKTTFARLSLGGEAVRAADRAVMVWCPRHLCEQSPIYTRAKKRKKSLNIVTLPLWQ